MREGERETETGACTADIVYILVRVCNAKRL